MLTKIKNFFHFLLGKHNARNATVITTSLTAASRVFAYGRVWLVAYLFGASAFVDSFYVAFGAIGFITGTIQGTLESAILPKLVQNDKKTSENLIGWIIRNVAIICLVISVVTLIFPEEFIKLFARTFDKERISYAGQMVKYILPGSMSILFIGILSMWANYKERFAVPNTITSFANIIAIPALLLLYPIIGKYALPAFQSVSYVILAAGMWYILKEIPLRPTAKIEPQLRSKTKADIFFCLISSGAGLIYTLVDRYFASSLPVGNVSAITYAQMIFSQPMGFMGAAMSIYLVRASEAVKSKEEGERQLFSVLYMAWSYFFPAAILLSVLAGPVVKLLLGYGAFDAKAVALTTPCLAVTALGLPILVWLTIMGRYVQALGKLRLLAVWSYIGITGNFFLDWLFVKPFGAPGLCAATTLMWGVSTFFFMVMLAPHIVWKLFKSLLPQTLAALAWGIPLWLLIGDTTILPLIIGGIIGLTHIIACEKIGFYSHIPEQWRPISIIKLFCRKLIR
ncbi:MAG: lipid II flippase MurJ [Synergistaceae bacterium]